ncbi:lamin tail domain-containing protein [Crocosphaera sp.]|uniref:lamin tail domain-containing protein n=1 Tax=Crocosphaera sp. TaxID=2729996 RepID=UPI002611FACB|nr:lamin tail domain-containing protein [Crocosphaera sp.]MDJ0582671.1 lamin tail domain-containing protein [Crocosphaera sp.]
MSIVGREQELVDEVGGDRDPLAVRFKLSDDTEFWAVANHFARGNEDSRNSQAKKLREWIERQTLPVVAMGDFNMDYSVDPSLNSRRPEGQCRNRDLNKLGNKAYETFTTSSDIRWIQPKCLSDGTCPIEGTGCFLPCFNSILDFVFLGGLASSDWQGTSEIGFKADRDYCSLDPEGDTDHRPVLATLTYPIRTRPIIIPNTSVKIVEIFPNPLGNNQVETQNEAITIENLGTEAVDLSGWKFRDVANQMWNLSGTVAPGERVEFRRNGQSMALNNNGDTVELLDATGNIVDFVKYEETFEGEIIAF